MNIGGDGDLEHMQKCLGELLDEENERQSIKIIMDDKEIKSDTPLTQMSDPVSDDQGKYIWNYVLIVAPNYFLLDSANTNIY